LLSPRAKLLANRVKQREGTGCLAFRKILQVFRQLLKPALCGLNFVLHRTHKIAHGIPQVVESPCELCHCFEPLGVGAGS
jgi:hypothetical protein